MWTSQCFCFLFFVLFLDNRLSRSTGSATSANLAIQLAKLAGLRVVVAVDQAKHGAWLSDHNVIRPDLVVDSHDASRATEVIRRVTKGRVRYGLDTRGRDSATHLLRALLPLHDSSNSAGESPPTPPGTPAKSSTRAHLVGMTGLPKWPESDSYALHAVPIKLFHEVPQIGGPIAEWLGRLLHHGLIVPPDIVDTQDGLESINNGLDRMRRGEISAGKLVVRV